MGQYLRRQTGHTSKGNSRQRDMTDEGQQADERHITTYDYSSLSYDRLNLVYQLR